MRVRKLKTRNRSHPGRLIDQHDAELKKLAEELKEEQAQKKAGTPGEAPKKEEGPRLIGRCAYCGCGLFHERAFHWIYDEDGQRVRKCNDEKHCRRARKKIPKQEDSFRRAVMRYSSQGKGAWVDFGEEQGADRDE